jgi:hypothetical protein
MARRISAARSWADAVCDSISEGELRQAAPAATLRAADLGDPDAQLCALVDVVPQICIQANDDADPERSRQCTQRTARYREQSLASGNWPVAALMMRQAFAPPESRGCWLERPGMDPLPRPCDPTTYYRMLRLLRLGSNEEYAQLLDRRISNFVGVENPAVQSAGLSVAMSADQLREAESWALDQYQHHFSSNPILTSAPRTICGDF